MTSSCCYFPLLLSGDLPDPPKSHGQRLGTVTPAGWGDGWILSPGLEGSWRRWGLSGVAAAVVAPRNKGSVRLAAPAAHSSCWGGFSRP